MTEGNQKDAAMTSFGSIKMARPNSEPFIPLILGEPTTDTSRNQNLKILSSAESDEKLTLRDNCFR